MFIKRIILFYILIVGRVFAADSCNVKVTGYIHSKLSQTLSSSIQEILEASKKLHIAFCSNFKRQKCPVNKAAFDKAVTRHWISNFLAGVGKDIEDKVMSSKGPAKYLSGLKDDELTAEKLKTLDKFIDKVIEELSFDGIVDFVKSTRDNPRTRGIREWSNSVKSTESPPFLDEQLNPMQMLFLENIELLEREMSALNGQGKNSFEKSLSKRQYARYKRRKKRLVSSERHAKREKRKSDFNYEPHGILRHGESQSPRDDITRPDWTVTPGSSFDSDMHVAIADIISSKHSIPNFKGRYVVEIDTGGIEVGTNVLRGRRDGYCVDIGKKKVCMPILERAPKICVVRDSVREIYTLYPLSRGRSCRGNSKISIRCTPVEYRNADCSDVIITNDG